MQAVCRESMARILMRPGRGLRLLAILAAVLSMPSALLAQNTFYFGHKPTWDEKTSFRNSIPMRPNMTASVFLFVKNDQQRALKNAYVEMAVLDGREPVWLRSAPLKYQGSEELPRGEVIRVQFEPAKEAKVPEVAKPADTAPAGAAPPPPPPPPGKRLPRGTPKLLLRLRDESAKDKVWAEQEVSFAVLAPQEYLVPEAQATANGLEIKVTTKSDDVTQAAFRNGKPSIVSLTFPPQPDLDVKSMGAGTFRRTLLPGAENAVVLSATDLPLLNRQNKEAKIRFYVEADGYPRAFIYQPSMGKFASSGASEDKLQPDTLLAVRVYPGNVAGQNASGFYYARPAAKPQDRYPVRVELDNPALRGSYDLIFERAGANKTTQDEIEKLQGPRDITIWADLTGPDGQWTITNQCADWVVQLDTYMLRGPHALSAADLDKVTLVLDDTPPNLVELTLASQHIKGQPLKVIARASDKETPVRRVIISVGPPPGPDGKRVAEPIKIEAVADARNPEVWMAEVQLPPEAKGPLEVAATAMNEVGLESTQARKIILVDAPAPAGDLVVKVLRGNRPQPGVNVKLIDAEGKDKGTLTTNEKGSVKFEKLAPGMYGIASVKPDSSSGSKAQLTVKIEAGKTTESVLTLQRGP